VITSLEQSIGAGAGSATIAAKVEAAIAAGELAPGDRLPAVRDLAQAVGVSPATVAAAYRTLNHRGLLSANRRRGTVVAPQPPLRVRAARQLPPGVRDLVSGNPDPAFLPPLAPVLERLDPTPVLYGAPAKLARLVELARDDFVRDGVAGEIAVVSGALDGIERVLQTQLRPGDRVVVEDPSWPRTIDLLHALGLRPEPVAVDGQGLVPEELERALARGPRAVVAVPRGQNPTGAAVGPDRARALAEVLGNHPEVLLVQDDYVAAVAGAPYAAFHGGSARWAVVRSLAKVLDPDLRVAAVAGDPLTVNRLEGRQLLGPGWVSHLLQQMAVLLWDDPATKKLLARAARAYAERRAALVDALAGHGIAVTGHTGLGVWVPVAEEAATTQALLERGWAVSPGERFRLRTPPGIRITTTTLQPQEAGDLAAAVAEAAAPSASTLG
jgi:DNA-binding transcriptional MocR family regulator